MDGFCKYIYEQNVSNLLLDKAVTSVVDNTTNKIIIFY